MKNFLEKFCFDVYKSIGPNALKAAIPVIDFARKLKNKPKIPLREKMGDINCPDFSKEKVIMLHGVSVGEIQSLEKLIKRIKTDFPFYKIVVTSSTVTGQDLAKKKYSDIVDFVTYFPIDIRYAVNKFLDKINPCVILIAETELWPNFFCCTKEKNIPLFIINGRISDKSYKSYLKIKNFIKIILNYTCGIFCQSETDKDRFICLGADKEKTEVMKNLKFEIDKKPCDIDLKTNNHKILIAASTHSGEEEIILDIYQKLKKNIDNIGLIIAPRHLTRLDDVKKIIENKNLNYGLRTSGANFDDFEVIILDTLGELSKIYNIVDVAYIGGSFCDIGGHNPLEATICQKPAVSGPNIKNFRDIYAILERESAAFVVRNEKELYNSLEKLFTDKDFYNKISSNANACFAHQQGALDFVIRKLKEIL